MPTTASTPGRSPVATPTTTGTAADTTPVIGATTVMLPRASATYSPTTDTLPMNPATSPHTTALRGGASSSISGITTRQSGRITASANSATATGGTRLLARPPM